MKVFTEKHLKECIEYQMKLNWYSITYNTIKRLDKHWVQWYHDFTTTEKKEKEYKKWLFKYFKPFEKNKKVRKSKVSYFILSYWLRIINENSNSDIHGSKVQD